MADLFHHTVYAYGSPLDGFWGQMAFLPGGGIAGYTHFNETNWSVKNHRLQLHDATGRVSRVFKRDGRGQCWLGRAVDLKLPFVLVPVISLPAGENLSGLPPIFVNSLPKSGTYFMESILSAAGFRPTRLHISDGGVVDDYRDMPDEDIHRDPQSVRLRIDYDALAAVLSGGDVTVGHVSRRNDVKTICGRGSQEIVLIRNLRDVIISLFIFKKTKVKPTNMSDEYWRNVPPDRQLLAFIMHFIDIDLKYIGEFSASILDGAPERVVRFEDLIKCCDDDFQIAWMNDFAPELAGKFNFSARQVLNKPGPTFSGGRSEWTTVWDQSAEQFFEKSGLRDLNAALGYEN